MKIVIHKTDENYKMTATNESGNTVLMDASKDIGGEESAFRPMQLLLAALGGCSTIDIVMILKKQRQKIDALEVEIEADRIKVGEASIFKNIHLIFKAKGVIKPEKLEQAIKLSLDKYCSVAKTLEPTATITYSYTINNEKYEI